MHGIMESTIQKQNDASSTIDSPSISLDKSISTPVNSTGRLSKQRSLNLKHPGNKTLRFMNNSFTERKYPFLGNNCEIVFEEELEEMEERQKKLNKIIPIFDKREDLLFHDIRPRYSLQGDRSRSSEITLPKVIESKDEYSCFYEKPKHKFSNYLALIDKTERFNFMIPKSASEIKEDQMFDSQNAIEEVNQYEEDLAGYDMECLENRSNSVKSGSLSRVSNNSFIKKRIVDECVIFDREKEMSEIVC